MLTIDWGWAVYHVTENGWKKMRGSDVGELHYEYYPIPTDHPTSGNDPIDTAA